MVAEPNSSRQSGNDTASTKARADKDAISTSSSCPNATESGCLKISWRRLCWSATNSSLLMDERSRSTLTKIERTMSAGHSPSCGIG